MIRFILWLPVLLIMLLTGADSPPNDHGQPRQPHQNLRVLFIGNSYTIYNDLPLIVKQLASSAHESRPLEVHMVAMMGATLQEHWEDGFALQALKQGRWDYVILQGQSLRPLTDPSLTYKYARLLDAEIKKAGAQTVFFITWAHRDQPEAQETITNLYMKLAKELGAAVAPVGPAWQKALKEDPHIDLYREDADSHPTPAGSYLAACVFYAILYGKSPVGLTKDFPDAETEQAHWKEVNLKLQWGPENISDQDAAFLQRIAWQTTESFDGR
jgi:hypothetical protein